VLDLESYLKLWAAWSPPPDENRWGRIAEKVWFRVFAMSNADPRDRPSRPADFTRGLAATASEQDAAIYVLAAAAAATAGRPELRETEPARFRDSLERFLATPEGRAHKKYLDDHPLP